MVFVFEVVTNEDDGGDDNDTDDVDTSAHAVGTRTYDVMILVNVCSIVTWCVRKYSSVYEPMAGVDGHTNALRTAKK